VEWIEGNLFYRRISFVTQSFNASLSNASFAEKRPAITRESLLRLNAYFQDVSSEERWGEEEIAARSRALEQSHRLRYESDKLYFLLLGFDPGLLPKMAAVFLF
jgi:hypothetical protein